MELRELLKYRRIDAISKGYNLRGRKWTVSYSGAYDENGHRIVRVKTTDISNRYFLWFDSTVDVNENVMSSTGLKTLDLHL